ncbi:MAG TPA: hypothetical protein VEY91_03725 [Candidatus Limnocylindria bacterium]|nr:hypothetical protein [Candidatus Limnocylindria bacterium]
MQLTSWCTREALDPGFERAWRECLSRSPHAHFGLSVEHLRWQAAHGRAATAMRAEEGGRCAALVIRDEGPWRACGWPWRWEAVIGDPARDRAEGMSPEELDWVFGIAQRMSRGRRLRCFLPVAPGGRTPGYLAGSTLLRRLEGTDAELLKTMDVNKRGAVKRAVREGFTVERATRPEQYLAFARLQRETERRRGDDCGPIPDTLPLPGESWREWEHPWMMLLIVMRAGTIEGGSGFGVYPGATVDYRANASTLDAKRLGANVLLAYEGLRQGRDLGCRWMNWGGATVFKRELGGERVDLHCRLGGGAVWALPNQLTHSLNLARPQISAWWRALRAGVPGRRG